MVNKLLFAECHEGVVTEAADYADYFTVVYRVGDRDVVQHYDDTQVPGAFPPEGTRIVTCTQVFVRGASPPSPGAAFDPAAYEWGV